MKSNCLFYALDQVHSAGGYIGFGMSTHWELQHAGHYDNMAHSFSAFVPVADLVRPWDSVLGFNGSVVVGDSEHRRPMPKHVMWRGILALAVGFWVWRAKRWLDSFYNKKK